MKSSIRVRKVYNKARGKLIWQGDKLPLPEQVSDPPFIAHVGGTVAAGVRNSRVRCLLS